MGETTLSALVTYAIADYAQPFVHLLNAHLEMMRAGVGDCVDELSCVEAVAVLLRPSLLPKRTLMDIGRYLIDNSSVLNI